MGSVTIDNIALSGPIASNIFPAATATKLGVAMIDKLADINIGAQVSWGLAPLPIGKFTQIIKISIVY